MKYLNILFTCFALTSSLAFAVDGLPYGADSVRIEGGKVNVKGMNGQSVNVDGGNVNVQGMNGQSVRTGGKAGQKNIRYKAEEEKEDDESIESKESTSDEDKD